MSFVEDVVVVRVVSVRMCLKVGISQTLWRDLEDKKVEDISVVVVFWYSSGSESYDSSHLAKSGEVVCLLFCRGCVCP
jgi:hypothetical protein